MRASSECCREGSFFSVASSKPFPLYPDKWRTCSKAISKCGVLPVFVNKWFKIIDKCIWRRKEAKTWCLKMYLIFLAQSVLSHAVRQWHTHPGLEPHQCLYAVSMSIKIAQPPCWLVSRCHTTGESEESVAGRQQSMQVRKSTLDLKPRAEVSRSPKQGYQWPT